MPRAASGVHERLLSAALLAALLAQSAWSATFVVNGTADVPDATPGDGLCATSPGGSVCTLRAAILEANALPGPDTVTLPAGTYVITRTEIGGIDGPGELDFDVTDDLTITGAGAASTILDGNCTTLVDAGSPERVIEIHAGATVAITGVTIRDACTFGPGGGIANHVTLTLTDTVVEGNISGVFTPTLSGRSGGGIANDGTLTVRRSTIADNAAYGGQSEIAYGGGLRNTGTATIEDSTISGNAASYGGGISSTGTLTIENSTVSGNYAAGFPLIYGFPPVALCVSGGAGGGLQGTGTVRDSTVAANVVSPGMPLAGFCDPATGGGLSGSFTLRSSIVDDDSPFADCAGTITSEGHNVARDLSCALTGAGDQNGVDPLLGPLADNGGPTRTHRLLAGTPPLDAGDPATCPPADQRGVARPQGAACDVGAYEATAPCGNGVIDPGEDCDDGNPFDGDCCSATCHFEAAENPCGDDGNVCTDDRCDGAGVCRHADNTAPCEDGNVCTTGDTCAGGVCVAGAGSPCDPCDVCDPGTGCAAATAVCQAARPRGARLAIRNYADDTRDSLTWQWRSEGPLALGDLGDPTAGTDYRLCLFDDAGGAPRLRATLGIPGAGTCDGTPCWKAKGSGFRFNDRSFPPAGSLVTSLRAGGATKGTIALRRRRGSIGDPGLPYTTPVTVRLLRRDAPVCFESRFGHPARNDAGRFEARSD
jgi:CSLREA domain-containing protein